jgi:hypothetical protein
LLIFLPPQNSMVSDGAEYFSRMRKKTVQQGRSKQRGESYPLPYGEPLSDARTPLADFLRILLRNLGIPDGCQKSCR